MESINRKISGYRERPITVLQYGEGNFLRVFADYMIDIANEKELFNGNIIIVKPREKGSIDKFKKQNCQYTVMLKGCIDQQEYEETRIISSVNDCILPHEDYKKYIALSKIESLRFVISNTTEAGIVFNKNDLFTEKLNISFPAKLTQFLFERFKYFKHDLNKGLIILPVELIDNNGDQLKACVKQYIALWNLPECFKNWIDEACVFANTLVDRIVTGYPSGIAEIEERLGYKDELLCFAEPFALWVIESQKQINNELPLDKALADKVGMRVIFTDDHKPYKQRKVRILNGAHTAFVLASYLKGNDYVNQSMNDECIRNFLEKTIFEEIIPTLEMPKDELEEFAWAVMDRFNNPAIQHSLLDISMNSVSKFKVRCLPSLLRYVQLKKELPNYLTFSLAALLAFYTSDKLIDGVLKGKRNDQEYDIKDSAEVLAFFKEYSIKSTEYYVEAVLKNKLFFGQNLTEIDGLYEKVCEYLNEIRTGGMEAALHRFFRKNEKIY